MLKQLVFTIEKSYENYRWFFTSNDALVIGGKSDEQNEAVLRKFSNPNYTVMHTSEPGSSFMIIKSINPSKKDLNETAIFTACFSKQWKKTKPNTKIKIDIFKRNQIYKTKSMKLGTFGIKGKKNTIKVKPELFLVIQKGKLRAVPKIMKEKRLAKLTPGNLTKEQASEKIAKIIKDKFSFPISKQEIMSAIPSDKLNVI